MPRRRRFCPPNYPVHVMQRGINRQACFASDDDMAAYAHWLDATAQKYEVQIHAWVFMTNHVHLLLTPTTDTGVSRLMQDLGRLYVRRFNYRYARTGSLFQDRFKSSLIEHDAYLMTCLRYIEMNPVRAGMVKRPDQYKWSSYAAHGLGTDVSMWTPHPLYLALGSTRSEQCKRHRDAMGRPHNPLDIQKIRHCVQHGLALGSERFRKEIADLAGETTRDKAQRSVRRSKRLRKVH